MLLRLRNNVGPTPWTSLGRLAVIVPAVRDTAFGALQFVCIMPRLLTSIAFLQFLVVVNTRDLAPRVTEVLGSGPPFSCRLDGRLEFEFA